MTLAAYGRATHLEIPPCLAQALERWWSVDQVPSLHLAVEPAGRGCAVRDVALRACNLGRGADRS